MEANTNLSEATRDLPDVVLDILSAGFIKKANKWTLTQKNGNFYLSLEFTNFKFGAKTLKLHVKPSQRQTSAKSDCGLTQPIRGTPADLNRGKLPESQDSPSTQESKPAKDLEKPKPKPKQKRKRSSKKSPSTRRRNRRRLLDWLSRKKCRFPKGSQDNCPATQRQEATRPEACSGISVQSREHKSTEADLGYVQLRERSLT